jgi:hypothetical protein
MDSSSVRNVLQEKMSHSIKILKFLPPFAEASSAIIAEANSAIDIQHY